MQIGCCWFDSTRQELLNQPLSSSWQMAPHESEVLSQLVQRRGQVVSIQALQQAVDNQVRSDDSLSEIIYRIRSFLGKEHESLIETVSNQGYLLHSKSMGNRQSLLDTPKRIMPFWRYIVLTLSTLAVVGFMYNAIGHADFFQPHYQQEVVTQQGKRVVLHWYAVDDQQDKLLEQVGLFTHVLESCRIVPWTSVLLALSHDEQTASILLKNDMKESVQYKNIKVILDKPGLNFASKEWVVEAGVCE